jgi:hypothetical protein
MVRVSTEGGDQDDVEVTLARFTGLAQDSQVGCPTSSLTGNPY